MISARPDREDTFLRLVEDDGDRLDHQDDQAREDRVREYAPAPGLCLATPPRRVWPGPDADPVDPVPDLAA